MKGQATLFSRVSDDWATPQALYDELHREFDFQIDCAANVENTKCEQWFGPGHVYEDALTVDWGARRCWLNPPYSRVREFMGKAHDEAIKGATVVTLVPSRTDTRWWHEFVWSAKSHGPYWGVETRFIKGRLKFGGSTNSAPFPSVVVVFRP